MRMRKLASRPEDQSRIFGQYKTSAQLPRWPAGLKDRHQERIICRRSRLTNQQKSFVSLVVMSAVALDVVTGVVVLSPPLHHLARELSGAGESWRQHPAARIEILRLSPALALYVSAPAELIIISFINIIGMPVVGKRKAAKLRHARHTARCASTVHCEPV